MIKASKVGAIWRITIDRPEKANSLSAAMLQELINAVYAARTDTNVLVLTGAGTVFSAGADLQEAKEGLATSALWEELSHSIATLPSLTIAALNGTVAGGAFGMALACDLRVAVREARFFYPVMKMGFLPQPSDPKRMKALIGPAKTKLIFLGGQNISATTALDWGLVDHVVQRAELHTKVAELAADASAADAGHLAAIKNLIG